jgi:hypothetical protein
MHHGAYGGSRSVGGVPRRGVPLSGRPTRADASGETDLGLQEVSLMVRRVMKRFGAAVSVAAVVLTLSVSVALAGEVKGPPGQIDNTNTTGALEHARSACAASGLNDFDSAEGQNASQVQTAADSWKYYGLPKGAPGTFGLCRGEPAP